MKVATVPQGSQADNAGRATRVLVALSAVLILLMAYLFVDLTARQHEMKDSIREDALWAVYQLDREGRSLEIELRSLLLSRAGRIEGEALKRATLRYDILYSRLTVLDNTQYADFLEVDSDFIARRETVSKIVLGIEPVFNDVTKNKFATIAQIDEMHAAAAKLTPITERLLTFINAAVSAARADARVEVMRLQGTSAVVALFLGLSLVLLVLNLMKQLKSVRAVTRQIEEGAQRLSIALDAAEAGNRTKSEFMATISHEIRTPLNAVLGMAELLSHADLADDDREKVRVIRSSGAALLEVINEILDYAKIEQGKIEFEKLAFCPAKIIRECAELMDVRAREQRNHLIVQVDQLPAKTCYMSDPSRLRRVLLNLVSNALKFTEDGIVRVRAMESEDASRLRFEVVDTGIGIPAEARDRLFSPFSQVDGTISRRFGGTGLGLAICKRIVEGLGGEIGVDSAVGVGSRFWFEVPLERGQCARTVAIAEVEDEAGLPLPALSILVVEDNPVNRDLAGRFLSKLGQRVTFAEDGLVGVAKAAAQAFDLILMDMQMPRMDGIAAAEAIRAAERGRRVPIVAMTANASDDDRRRCQEAGMDGFESKPLTLARMEATIRFFGAGFVTPAANDETPAARAAPEVLGAKAQGEVAPGMDPARREELISVVGLDGLEELTRSFVDDAVQILVGIRAAMAAEDAPTLDRALHSLKGSAANLGFDQIARLAEANRRRPVADVEIDQIVEALHALSGDHQMAA